MKRLGILAALTAVAGAGGGAYVMLRSPATPAPSSKTLEFTPEEWHRILQHSPLGSPPPDSTNAVADNPEAARFGQSLFFDPRFSGKGTVSCATCHDPRKGFGDGQSLSPSFPIDRNIPTIWNVAYNRWYFWDGRADSLWSQALQPLENPREMGGTRLQFADLLSRNSRLKARYERTFGPMPDLSDVRRFPVAGSPLAHPADNPLRQAWESMQESDRLLVNRIFSNMGKALAAYERRIVSRRSPFDQFVEGLRSGNPVQLQSISSEARRGLKLFVGRANCWLCHSGPNFSDGEFHNLGILPIRGAPTPDRFEALDAVRRDPFNSKSPYSDDRDAGAKKLDFLAKQPDTWGQVKTPGLRNVGRTSPYMHQGQFRTLEEVVRFYSTLSMAGTLVRFGHSERAMLTPLMLTPDEISALVAFLETLTDEQVDPELLKPPD